MQPDSAMVPAERRVLLSFALLLVVIKGIEFALDSQAIFYPDSGAFILNALGLAFLPERSYVYGWLIRAFAVPFHSLRAIVAMQLVMVGVSAWLLTFLLMRFFRVRPWIAITAGLLLAMNPVQFLYEHMIMTETPALLVTALYLVAALAYLRRPSFSWLVLLSFLGILLVSLRIVYLPVVLSTAILIPMVSYSIGREVIWRPLALAVAVSCAVTMLFHVGYRQLTGTLGHRAPAYNFRAGGFLLATVSPIVQASDAADERVAELVITQSSTSEPIHLDRRSEQLFLPIGLVNRIGALFDGDEQRANEVAQRLAVTAIRRNPLGYLRMGLHNYLNYWRWIPRLRWALEFEQGTTPSNFVRPADVAAILSAFQVDVSNQDRLLTLSRNYHIRGRSWYVFLLVSPFLVALALVVNPVNPNGMVVLLVWSILLLLAMCIGGVEACYRYLHPFSLMVIAGCAVMMEKFAGQRPSTAASASTR